MNQRRKRFVGGRFRGQTRRIYALMASVRNSCQRLHGAVWDPSGWRARPRLLRCGCRTDAPRRRFISPWETKIWQDGKQFRPAVWRVAVRLRVPGGEPCLRTMSVAPEPALRAYRRRRCERITAAHQVWTMLLDYSAFEKPAGSARPRGFSGGERPARGGRPCFVYRNPSLAAHGRSRLLGSIGFSKKTTSCPISKIALQRSRCPFLYVSPRFFAGSGTARRLHSSARAGPRRRRRTAWREPPVRSGVRRSRAQARGRGWSLDGKIEAHDAAYGLDPPSRFKGGTLLVPETGTTSSATGQTHPACGRPT